MADVPVANPPAEIWTAGPTNNPLSDPYTGSEAPAPMPASVDMSASYHLEHGPVDMSGAGYQYGNGGGPDTSGVGYNGSGMSGRSGNVNPQ